MPPWWHEAREASVNDPEHAYLPEEDAIQAALEHTSFDNVVLDEAASTVYLTDPAQRLDVGAVAKGYAAGAVAAALPTGMVLSLGGNVCVTGPKPDGSPWVIGVQNPDGDDTEYVQRWISPAARWSPAGTINGITRWTASPTTIS